MIRKYAEIFCWKNVSSFCSAKATHIFSAKNIRLLNIESAKTVNEMTLNELVKLTTLWTTGPSTFGLKKCLIWSYDLGNRTNLLQNIYLLPLQYSQYSWYMNHFLFPQNTCCMPFHYNHSEAWFYCYSLTLTLDLHQSPLKAAFP